MPVRCTSQPIVWRLDTEWFETLVAAGEWSEAADLVGGEFLEGFGVPGASDFEDWLLHEREAWRRLGTQALSRAAGESLGSGSMQKGIELARRALGLDPSRQRPPGSS